MKAPAVSVILPVFNGERYLARAIASVLAQTFADFELIAVDDGSSDRTPAILGRCAKNDARIRIVSRANTGIVGALNDGIASARGEYLARMDADDLCEPERFARQVEYLRAHPECVILGTQILRIDPGDLPIGPETQPLDHETILARLLEGSAGTLTHPSVMMRRDAVEAVGRYRQEFQWVEDYDLFLRLAERGRLANLPDMLLRYRLHYESVNMKRREAQARLAHQCLSAACAHLGIPDRKPVAMLRWLDEPRDRISIRGGWARRALACGNFATARKHALRNVLAQPWRPVWWKTFLLGVLRRPTIAFRSRFPAWLRPHHRKASQS